MCIEPIFFIHFCVLVHLSFTSVLAVETGLAGMARVPLSLNMLLFAVSQACDYCFLRHFYVLFFEDPHIVPSSG